MPRKKKTVTPYEKEELKAINQIVSKMTVPVEITDSLEDLLEELTKVSVGYQLNVSDHDGYQFNKQR